MELGMREWMILSGLALVLVILADAVRRTMKYRRENQRVMRTDRPSRKEPEANFDWLKELPSGGARVIERGVARDGQSSVAEPELLPLGEVPEVLPDDKFDIPWDQSQDRPHGELGQEDSREAETARVAPEPDPSDQSNRNNIHEQPLASEQADELSQDPSPVAPTRTVDWLEALELSSDDAEDEMPVALIDDAPPDHVLLIHVKAEGHRPYRGDQLLQLLLACDLRFGDLGFFHRHEHAGGRGPIQFSVSNLLKPGVFDIDAMSDLEAAGIVLFMRVPGPKDLLTAYDAMLETAKTLVHHLGGSLLDHSHSVLTKQAIEHDRSLLRDYARRQLLHRKP
jgi:cell division protein ZipA